jgi:hypothetical protein
MAVKKEKTGMAIPWQVSILCNDQQAKKTDNARI